MFQLGAACAGMAQDDWRVMMGILAISVRSGLCNRLRVVLSAIAYCELTNRRLQIHWPRVDEHATEKEPGRGFEARLCDLFDHPFEEISEQQFSSTGRTIRQTEISIDTPGDLRLRTINMFPGRMPPEDLPNRAESHPFLADRENYVKTFAEYWSVMKPTAQVQAFINEGVRLIAGRHPCVAAIVRHCPIVQGGETILNANYETSRRSPPEKFVARMKLFPKETVFFLTADCLEVESLMRAEFGERIVQLPQTYCYDKTTIQKRTAEMYIAARCDRILGCYISSFAEFTGWLAGGRYSACYRWSASEGERYEDVGLCDQDEHEMLYGVPGAKQPQGIIMAHDVIKDQ